MLGMRGVARHPHLAWQCSPVVAAHPSHTPPAREPLVQPQCRREQEASLTEWEVVLVVHPDFPRLAQLGSLLPDPPGCVHTMLQGDIFSAGPFSERHRMHTYAMLRRP